jgi:hypothetical protein
VAYLAQQVPHWSAKNRCFSCHNNGDGARALYTAVRFGWRVPIKAVADTQRWLGHPEKWDDIGERARYSDARLARLQFAAALAAAVDAGRIQDTAILKRAAKLVAEGQKENGSWRVDGAETTGAPAVYGDPLATYLGRLALHKAGANAFHKQIARADRWFRQVPVRNVFSAATVLLGLSHARDAAAQIQRKKCLALIRQGQSRDGGWGPYTNSSSEPFDTALVVLALSTPGMQRPEKTMRNRGRAYLIAIQQKDGSWPATTRPAGSASYAQHISTTGWATIAMLTTSPKRTMTPK